MTRRGLFRSTVGGLAATAALGTVLPRNAAAQSALSPDAALQALMDGNKRFVSQTLTSLHKGLAILKAHTLE
jgi:carbonic anhydrase